MHWEKEEAFYLIRRTDKFREVHISAMRDIVSSYIAQAVTGHSPDVVDFVRQIRVFNKTDS